MPGNVDNREVTSAVARGAKDDRPQLERISPNIEYGNYLSRKGIEEVLREFKNAEKKDRNLWQNITGGNTVRKWIPDMYDNNVKRVALKVIVEKALKGYITIVQERYPTLKYFKVGALKSLPGGQSHNMWDTVGDYTRTIHRAWKSWSPGSGPCRSSWD